MDSCSRRSLYCNPLKNPKEATISITRDQDKTRKRNLRVA